MQCNDADELLALAKAELYDMTREEAEAYITEKNDFELDDEMLMQAAGGASFYATFGKKVSRLYDSIKTLF